MCYLNPISSLKTIFSNLSLSSAMTTLQQRVSNFASGVFSSIGALFRNAATSFKNFIWKNEASNQSQPDEGLVKKEQNVKSDSEGSTTSSPAHSNVESSDSEADNELPVDTGRGQGVLPSSASPEKDEQSE